MPPVKTSPGLVQAPGGRTRPGKTTVLAPSRTWSPMTAPSLFLPVNSQLSSRHHSVFAAIMAKIGTYRSGAEINVTANNGIPRITQMRNKCAVADDTIFQLHSLPYYTAIPPKIHTPLNGN